MNARIINLRTRRKQKARQEKAAKGTVRAVEFGRSKAEKNLTRSLNDQQDRRADGHKLDTPDPRNDD